MKQHATMALVSALFLIGCVTTQDEETFLQRLRACDESSATLSRVEINYNCTKLSCNASACGIKICNADAFGGVVTLDELEIDQGRCRAEFQVERE